ncbi:hypothetical protein CLV58_109127 [Spirosoma oryzae]|uniref:Uncharacterized protein n=1 Tax=Spirosoma oryzae TaxID=1469603 RepID=A0A2T0SYC5_9BACT|nr:hypothetical protein [Spirosoma oryzae]PRY38400.1 hypothetical protein CLV58_109127 [Spirosoma oryzae]
MKKPFVTYQISREILPEIKYIPVIGLPVNSISQIEERFQKPNTKLLGESLYNVWGTFTNKEYRNRVDVNQLFDTPQEAIEYGKQQLLTIFGTPQPAQQSSVIEYVDL